MTDDHTYNGIPVAQVSTEDINACLEDGIHINNADGHPDAEVAVRKRLILELEIRQLGLRL